MGAVGAVALAGLAACGQGGGQSVAIDSDWPVYSTLDELWERSHLVVEARLGGEAETRLDDVGGAPELASAVAVYQAVVLHTWKGELAGGSVIAVKELVSAEVDGTEYHLAEDAPPLAPGTTYLLFLDTFPAAPDGEPAGLLNPWQGRYVLDGRSTLQPEETGEPAVPDVEFSLTDLEELDPDAGEQDPRLAEGYVPGSPSG